MTRWRWVFLVSFVSAFLVLLSLTILAVSICMPPGPAAPPTFLEFQSSDDVNVIFSPDSQWLAFAGSDGVYACSLPNSGRCSKVLERNQFLNSIAITCDSRTMLVADWSSDLHVVNISDGKLLQSISFEGRRVQSVAASPVDDHIVVELDFDVEVAPNTTMQRSDIVALHLVDPSTRHRLESNVEIVRYPPVFSPDGMRLALSVNDYFLKVWRVRDWNQVQPISTPDESHGTACAFDPAGDQLAFGGYGSRCRIWSLQSDQQVNSFSTRSRIRALAYHPHGNVVVLCNHPAIGLGYHGATLSVFDPNGHSLNSFRVLDNRANSLAISNDGKYVAVAGHDGGQVKVRIWSWEAVLGAQ